MFSKNVYIFEQINYNRVFGIGEITGTCIGCGKSFKRSKTFTKTMVENDEVVNVEKDMYSKLDAWESNIKGHKMCKPNETNFSEDVDKKQEEVTMNEVHEIAHAKMEGDVRIFVLTDGSRKYVYPDGTEKHVK
jgi:hypothetical protein